MINIPANTLGTPIALPAGSDPRAIAITPDGAHAYVANYASTVSVINILANTLGTPIALPVGSNPAAIAITPDGAHAYVAN